MSIYEDDRGILLSLELKPISVGTLGPGQVAAIGMKYCLFY